jgi:hypothetical protein
MRLRDDRKNEDERKRKGKKKEKEKNRKMNYLFFRNYDSQII